MPFIENVKTFVLWAMILTSVVLTYLVSTYQPAYNVLDQGDNSYIEIEDIGETKSFTELLYPSQVISHSGEERSWVHPAGDNYLEIMETLQEFELEEMELTGSHHAPGVNRSFNGMELIFDEALEGDWLQYLVGIDDDMILIDRVDRIIVTETSGGTPSDVAIRFVDMEAEEVYQSPTSVTVSDLESFSQGIALEETEVEPRVLNEREDSNFQPVRYLPVEPVMERVFTYETTHIAPDGFIQTLFTDPDYVRQYFQEGEDSSYTDGTRMMDMTNRGAVLEYVRPDLTAGSQIPSQTIVRASQEFVNGHFGWTDDYYATSWTEGSNNDRASFTMHVQGMPVFDSNAAGASHYTIDVTRSGNEIIEYSRPMFQLEERPFDIDTNVELPPYSEVEAYIEDEMSAFPLEAVEDARVAYNMSRQNSIAVFEPVWFVYARGQWHQVDVAEESVTEEVLQDGLEQD